MNNFIPDKQIKELPVCSIQECNNPAMMMISGRFICGACAVKYNQIESKMIFAKMGGLKSE